MQTKKILAWWSGGVTSAIACYLAIDIYGKENVAVVFINTNNEHPDTIRFKNDCEKLYGIKIESISNKKYENIQQVWRRFLALNNAHGAICSSELKREVRIAYQNENPFFDHQVFGFDIDEPKRAKSMTLNYPNINPIYPILLFGYTKKKCIQMLNDFGIEVPIPYKEGFHNNNCYQTGCVQGGIGYWQKMKDERPDAFEKMAAMEHELTDKKGEPVTICKDQSKGGGLVFLKPHPAYPLMKDISMMKGRPVEALVDCNGFCGINDLLQSNKK